MDENAIYLSSTGRFLEKYKKSPENLIITVKRSVYKAFKAFKYLNSDLLK